MHITIIVFHRNVVMLTVVLIFLSFLPILPTQGGEDPSPEPSS